MSPALEEIVKVFATVLLTAGSTLGGVWAMLKKHDAQLAKLEQLIRRVFSEQKAHRECLNRIAKKNDLPGVPRHVDDQDTDVLGLSLPQQSEELRERVERLEDAQSKAGQGRNGKGGVH